MTASEVGRTEERFPWRDCCVAAIVCVCVCVCVVLWCSDVLSIGVIGASSHVPAAHEI